MIHHTTDKERALAAEIARLREERNEALEALRGVSVMLQAGQFPGMEREPWAERVRAAMKGQTS